MDIDFDALDLDNDYIKAFINFKLEEIKTRNYELSNQLQKKKKLFNEYVNQTQFDKTSTYNFDKYWKRAIGNYIIIGFCSNQPFELIDDVKVVLQWEEKKPFYYSIKTFTFCTSNTSASKLISNEIKNVIGTLSSIATRKGTTLSSVWIESATNFSEIIAVINIPDFSFKRYYNFGGTVLMKTKENEIQVALPGFQITVEDLYNSDVLISEHDVLGYQKEAILSFLSLNSKVELVLCIEERNTNKKLEEIFLECMKKVTHSNNLYILRNVCNTSLGSLIKIHEVIEDGLCLIHVFFGVQADLEILIHFLFKNIPFLTIIPKGIGLDLFKKFDEDLKLLLSKPIHKRLLHKLGKCMELEMELLETVLVENVAGTEFKHKTDETNCNINDIINFSVNKEDYFKLRKQLIPLEDDSTFLYGIINSKTNSC